MASNMFVVMESTAAASLGHLQSCCCIGGRQAGGLRAHYVPWSGLAVALPVGSCPRLSPRGKSGGCLRWALSSAVISERGRGSTLADMNVQLSPVIGPALQDNSITYRHDRCRLLVSLLVHLMLCGYWSNERAVRLSRLTGLQPETHQAPASQAVRTELQACGQAGTSELGGSCNSRQVCLKGWRMT